MSSGAAGASGHDPIQQEIEQARAEVSATVHQLAVKLDVGQRMKRGVQRRLDELRTAVLGHPVAVISVIAGGGAATVVLLRLRKS